MTLNRHVKVIFIWNRRQIVVVVAVFNIHRPARHLQHTDVLNLGVAALVVFRDTRMHTTPTPNTPCQIQGIHELHPVHRLDVPNIRANVVPLLNFTANPVERNFHLRRRHLLVVLLKKLLHRRRIIAIQIPQRAQRSCQRRQTTGRRGTTPEKTPPSHAGSAHALMRVGPATRMLIGGTPVLKDWQPHQWSPPSWLFSPSPLFVSGWSQRRSGFLLFKCSGCSGDSSPMRSVCGPGIGSMGSYPGWCGS